MEESSRDRRFKENKKPRERVEKVRSLRKKKRARKGVFKRHININNDVADAPTTTETEEVDADNVASTSTDFTITANEFSVMQKKCIEALTPSPIKHLTRKGKRDSPLFCEENSSPLDGYKVIDSSVVVEMINCASKCTYCGVEKQLDVKQHNDKRKGLCESLCIYCTVCNVPI